MYHYRAYELHIASELELPELDPTEPADEPEITIRLGDVPEELSSEAHRRRNFESETDRLLLRTKDVARYLVRAGHEVVIQPEPGVNEKDVRVFLLGSCFGALLHQRGILALHANTIEAEGRAIAFVGRSGAGKSTLVAALIQRGCKLLADDVTAVVPGVERLEVLPAFPRTKLWADSAAALGYDVTQLTSVRDGIEKYEVPLRDQFCRERLPLGGIFQLLEHPDDDVELAPIESVHRLQVVLRNTYRKMFLSGLGMRPQHFQLSSRVAQETPIWVAKRPATLSSLPEFADLVMQTIRSLEP